MSINFVTFYETNHHVLGDSFDSIGQTTNLGTKRFLAYNEATGWGYKDLNIFLRMIRCFFGVYGDTHLKKVYSQIIEEHKEFQQVASSDKAGKGEELAPFPYKAMNKILISWQRSQVMKKEWGFIVPEKCREMKVDCKEGDIVFLDENKRKIYNEIKKKIPIEESVDYQKYSFPSIEKVLLKKLFENGRDIDIQLQKGDFDYPESSDTEIHWTANFSGPQLLGLCLENCIITQKEVQTIEHPGLYHLYSALQGHGTTKELNGSEIALIRGANRVLRFNASELLGDKTKSYGRFMNDLELKNLINEEKIVILFNDKEEPRIVPRISNIFAMSAPIVPERLSGREYTKPHLQDLFLSSATAFSSIRYTHPIKKVVVHSGNWGCGMKGNGVKTSILIQLFAAYFSKIDEVVYHSRGSDKEFNEALDLFHSIKEKMPDVTVNDLMEHLAINAESFGLTYKRL